MYSEIFQSIRQILCIERLPSIKYLDAQLEYCKIIEILNKQEVRNVLASKIVYHKIFAICICQPYLKDCGHLLCYFYWTHYKTNYMFIRNFVQGFVLTSMIVFGKRQLVAIIFVKYYFLIRFMWIPLFGLQTFSI